MKKIICAILCVLLLPLAGCNVEKVIPTVEASKDNEEKAIPTVETGAGSEDKVVGDMEDIETEYSDQSPNCETVITALQDGGVPISYYILYNEETDPNTIEYGKDTVHEYLKKANFADDRIETDYDRKKPKSGTVEIFQNSATANSRANSLYESGVDTFSYRILSEKVLIRLSSEYTKEQAEEIADIIGGRIHSIDDDVAVREEIGDALDKYQGDWKDLDSRFSELSISGNNLDFIHKSTTEEKENNYVHTFHFGINESGNLVVMNQYSKICYTISLGEDGILTIADTTGTTKPRMYKKVSDSTEILAEETEIVNGDIPLIDTSEEINEVESSPEQNNTESTTNSPTNEPSNTNSSSNESPKEEDVPISTGRTVYVTRTGKKYHYDSNCNGGTYMESTLSAAKARGLTPCKKCAGG